MTIWMMLLSLFCSFLILILLKSVIYTSISPSITWMFMMVSYSLTAVIKYLFSSSSFIKSEIIAFSRNSIWVYLDCKWMLTSAGSSLDSLNKKIHFGQGYYLNTSVLATICLPLSFSLLSYSKHSCMSFSHFFTLMKGKPLVLIIFT